LGRRPSSVAPSRDPAIAQVQGTGAGRSLSRRSGLLLALVGALTLVGLLLRLPSFDDSLYGDEISTYYIVTGHSLGRVIDLLQGDSVELSPPLFFVLAWATEKLGDASQWTRLVSLLAGTAAIPLTYLLGLRTVGRSAAVIGSALVALSPFLIFYSTEARAYGLLLLLVLLSTLALLRALDTGRFGWWAAYAAFSCAAIYTHLTPVFVLAAQFAWALWTRPEARRPLLTANAAVAVAYLPWLPTVLDNTDSPGTKVIGLLQNFSLDTIRLDVERWVIGHPYLQIGTLPGRAAAVMLLAGVAAGLVGLVVRVARLHREGALPRPPATTVLVLMLALASPVCLALYSSIGDSVWDARNLTASWPGLALVMGALVTSVGGPLRVAAVVLVVGAFAIGAAKMLESGSQRPEYDAAARFIAREWNSRDAVVEAPFFTPGPLTELGGVALAHAGGATPASNRILRLGYPPLEEILRAGPYDPVPVPSAKTIAKRAATLARGGTLYLVNPGSAVRLETLGIGPLYRFYEALPARFRQAETRTFPGFYPVTVYEFRDEAGTS
jgi:mannosyltransferase